MPARDIIQTIDLPTVLLCLWGSDRNLMQEISGVHDSFESEHTCDSIEICGGHGRVCLERMGGETSRRVSL